VPGVVRAVIKTLGDRVHVGEIMAVLDSLKMGEAQIAYLDTRTALEIATANIDLALTKLEVAKAQQEVAKTQIGVAKSAWALAVSNIVTAQATVDVRNGEGRIVETEYQWQETIHDNAGELLKLLAGSARIDEITDAFRGKTLGENRGRTLKAYAELNFAQAAYKREKTLRKKGISSESDYLEAQKGYTSAKAEFETIKEELEFHNRLALMHKRRAVDAGLRNIKTAEQSVQSADAAVTSAAGIVHAAESALLAEEMEVRVALQNLQGARRTLDVARSSLHAAERKLHIFGLSEDEIFALMENAQGGALGSRNREEDTHTVASPDSCSLTHADVTRYVMRAPFDGVVIEKHIVLGQAMMGDAEAFVVADLSSVWVNINVYQKDLSVVRQGLPVLLTTRHNTSTPNGKISWLSPRIDEHTRTVLARVVLLNPDRQWRPGLFATAKIAVDEIEVPLLVPKTALQTVEDQLSVFVQTDEGFEPKPVMLGRRSETHAEVTKGLQPGQRYVAKGAFTLKAELAKESFGDGHAH